MDWQIWILAFAQTLVWAGLYYLFPALLPHWEADLRFGKTTLALGLSLALVTSALLSPFAGHLIDRGYGRVLLTTSALAGAVNLCLLAQVESWGAFLAVWVVMGITMAGCLYDPCFAYLVKTRGEKARRAITTVTLIAGLAGTVSFPINTFIAESYGWRAAVWTFAGIIAFIAAPAMWRGTKLTTCQQAVSDALPTGSKNGGGLRDAIRTRAFWLLSISFALLYLNHGTVITHILPILDSRGVSLEQAVLAASLLGPSQVIGRLVMVALEKKVSISAFGLISIGFVVVAALVLAFGPNIFTGVLAFSALQGMGIGMSSITRPVITAALMGTASFGAIAGAIATTVLLANALAPSSSSIIWSFGGYSAVLAVNIAVAIGSLAALAAALAAPQSTREP